MGEGSQVRFEAVVEAIMRAFERWGWASRGVAGLEWELKLKRMDMKSANSNGLAMKVVSRCMRP